MNKILKNFEKNSRLYENFSTKVNILLKELMDQENISYHSITGRIKEKESLSKKIEGKSKYQELEDITDIVGCRIITYFEDDVEKIVDIIGKEFEIDEDNSIDKKKIMDPDKFGYLSYHIVCSINNERGKLRENQNYKNIKFEIQIRTILQHAWAEIEHDIGYKSNVEVPRDFRRKFSRIAGMLEIVDDEFSRLKRDIHDYVKDISDKGIEDTDINADSLKIFIEKSADKKEIEEFVRKELKIKPLELTDSDKNRTINLTLKLINKFTQLKKIKELESSIKENKEIIKPFIIKWLGAQKLDGNLNNNGMLYYIIGISYLIFILVVKSRDMHLLANFLNPNLKGIDEETMKNIELAFHIYEDITKDRASEV